jgi:murein L,D-transpeptidase YcbB/YkuD
MATIIPTSTRRPSLLGLSLLAVTLQSYTAVSHALEPQNPPSPSTTASSPAPGTPPATPTPVVPAVPVVPPVPDNPIAQSIKKAIDSTLIRQTDSTEEVYRANNYHFIWQNNPHIEAALKLFEDAPSKGLDPDYYRVESLRSQWQKLKSIPAPTNEQVAEFDTLLTNRLVNYLGDVAHGRINPRKVNVDFPSNKDPKKIAQAVFAASKDGSFKATADKLEPTLPFYVYMRKALGEYSQAAKVLKDGKFTRAVSKGKSHPQIAKVRQYLIAFGDMSDDGGEAAYNEQLIEGIKHFQKRHGLSAKGTLNKETIAALNAPLDKKIEQIKLSLERLRWIPRFDEDRAVLVNIPSFQLWAFDSLKDEQAKPLTMRVVVGKAAGKQTPSFSSKMQYVEFRPTWSVPQSIIKHEFGNLLRNPGALARRGMKVSYHNGTVSVRQESGDKNALGLVKFLFPNNHSVYMHDTPSKHFFQNARRDFSHGCVRLGAPALMAEFALKNQTGNWTDKKIYHAMHTGGLKRVTLESQIPVIIFYGTALAVDPNGVHFYADVYGQDAKLKAALAQTRRAGGKPEKEKELPIKIPQAEV